MQLSSNVYLEIKVKGSDREGIVSYDMLQRFQLVETAGASLPYICFAFATFDKSLANLFMENNEVIVSLGETKEKANSFTLHAPTSEKDTDPSNNSWTIYYAGFIGSNEFMVNKGICKEYPGNSLMVAKQVIKEFAGGNPTVDTDIEKTNENQVIWRQLYTPSNAFLVDTLLHMDIQPSFPLFSFDKFGTFHIRDFNKLRDSEPQWVFTPFIPNGNTELQYINNFNCKSYKSSYNLYSGYDKVTEINKVTSDTYDNIITENVPILASTKETEHLGSGNRMALNKIQSDNVHNTYIEAYAHNTNCLMSLSSILGCVELIGYHPNLKPTDLIFIKMDGNSASDMSMEGKFLIDTIVVTLDKGIIKTYVYATRDNNNNIENFVAEKKAPYMKITKKAMQRLANSVSKARRAIAAASQIFDGTFLKYCTNYVTTTKVNLLRMFSVSGVMVNFNTQALFLQSLLFQGNALMNILINMIFPRSIASILRNFLIDKPSKSHLVSKYIDENVPVEIQGLVYDLIDSLVGVEDSLNSIAEDNNITVREIPTVAQTDNSSYNETEDRINTILTDFENNTTGLDIPLPIVELTEDQELLATNDLEDLIANETILNLEELGYMDGVDKDTFKDILLGNVPINFDIINKINENAGNRFNFRYWGTYGAIDDALYAWAVGDNLVYTKRAELDVYSRLYNDDASPYMGTEFKLEEEDDKYLITYTDIEGEVFVAERNEEKDINSNALVQLTDYFITKGYKDRYRTIPCTKLISATRNARLYFACPETEENLKFYINSKRVNLKSFPIDLGLRTPAGVKIMYNVYYTETGYNSNSTMLEVRQG